MSHGLSVALCAVSLSLTCGRPTGSTSAGAEPAASEPRAGDAGAVAASATPEPEASASRPGATPVIARSGIVSVDPKPRCEAAQNAMDAGVRHSWLADPTIQQRLIALERELRAFQASWIGTFFHDEPHEAVAVFHDDFRDYDRVRQRLLSVVPPLRVVLRPACHSAARIADAQRVIEERGFHPKAKSTAMAWNLDPSFSGFDVVIDDSAPDVAEALRARLGPLVRVKLGKPRRL